jgi:cytochrome P450 family 6
MQHASSKCQCFAESLRKHPPVATIDRLCIKPYTIPGTNIELEKDSAVAIPIMGLHHDPQYYPQPQVFDPNRFLPAEKVTRSPYVFLPFGTGPRNCIGNKCKNVVLLHFSFVKAVSNVWMNINVSSS